MVSLYSEEEKPKVVLPEYVNIVMKYAVHDLYTDKFLRQIEGDIMRVKLKDLEEALGRPINQMEWNENIQRGYISIFSKTYEGTI